YSSVSQVGSYMVVLRDVGFGSCMGSPFLFGGLLLIRGLPRSMTYRVPPDSRPISRTQSRSLWRAVRLGLALKRTLRSSFEISIVASLILVEGYTPDLLSLGVAKTISFLTFSVDSPGSDFNSEPAPNSFSLGIRR